MFCGSCAPERQAGPASEDSCSKFQMLNAKCSVRNALHPRYPGGTANNEQRTNWFWVRRVHAMPSGIGVWVGVWI